MYMYMHIPIANKQSHHTTHVHVHVLLDYIVPVIELYTVLVLVISNCIFTSNINSS